MYSLLMNSGADMMAQVSIISHISMFAAVSPAAIWDAIWPYLMIFGGFSMVIFIHELGHFMAAKWADVRVERFAIGFFTEVIGFTRGETRYSFNILPLGGYVKMLGQEDFEDKENELKFKSDPRSFANKPVYQRMIIVSAGVVMNIILAAFLFVIVFMYGKQENVTTIGHVLPESPAALAGLQPGDAIKQINGREIREYQEIKFAVMLADPHTPLDFAVERDGELMHIDVKPLPSQQRNLLQVGIAPATGRDVVFPFGSQFDEDNPEHLQAGDQIVAIGDVEITETSHPGGIEQLLRSPDGKPMRVTVLRSDKPTHSDGSVASGQPGVASGAGDSAAPEAELPKRRLDVLVFQQMGIEPSDPFGNRDTRNVLGLIPLVRVSAVHGGGRAELAGLRVDDIFLKFGSHDFPTQKQITSAIRESVRKPPEGSDVTWRQQIYNHYTWNPEQDIPIEILRDGVRKSMVITPKIKKGASPRVGMELRGAAIDHLRVAGVLEKIHDRKSPAAEAGIPSGALIQSVNDEPVTSWAELIDAFRRNAGSSVKLTYTTFEGKTIACDFRVPHCLRTKLNLSTLANVETVNNQRTITVETTVRYREVSASHPYGLYLLLQKALEDAGGVSATVKLEYRERPYGPLKVAELEITEDTVDPWLGRVRYGAGVSMQLQYQILKADGPLDALSIGLHKTWYFVMQVYTMMERMIFSRSVGVEHLSGPVGIVKLGSDIARVGFLQLLFFLAIISANLAVINFLPLPIVDGGLMVFLIIEKIKGSPVSLKVQVATQVVGLCLIVSAFLFVTFQDVLRLAG